MKERREVCNKGLLLSVKRQGFVLNAHCTVVVKNSVIMTFVLYFFIYLFLGSHCIPHVVRKGNLMLRHFRYPLYQKKY